MGKVVTIASGFSLGAPGKKRCVRSLVAEDNPDSKTLIKTCKETLCLNSDAYMPFATGVISDLGLLRKGTLDEDFKVSLAKTSAWGFLPWQAFVQGDYNFREMLLCLKIKKNEDISSVRVVNHVLTCDVADVVENRQVDVPAAETVILFDKKFHVVPQIQVTAFQTPEFCVPQISDVTCISFTIRLVTQNGSLSGGQISFSARGY